MELELKNVKIAKFASQETLCFAATGYVNGVKAFNVHNEGHGGSNFYDVLNRGLYNEAEAYAASLPPTVCDLFPEGLAQDLDIVISRLLDKLEQEKFFRRHCKTKTLFTLPGDAEGSYRTVKTPFDADVKTFILTKYPKATIINETL